jgi:starch-binding outer membrane protein, SusD/RagB family
MKRLKKYVPVVILILGPILLFNSCKDFFEPYQDINVTRDKLFDDWYEYRSVAMGMYGLQQQLVEQILILGELRGDLLTITENADADMVEIYNFNPSRENKYASPTNFFKLISATNNFINVLQHERPEVLDPKSPVTNYDRLYGEALCMRAWAYFNAVRIYGKVPFIHESLTSIEEIESYLNATGTYIDSVAIYYSKDGYYNDTIPMQPIELQKQYFDERLVIDYFTNELEKKVKAVGVNHYMDNNDISWEVTIWNTHAMNALLGHMYLTIGDLAKSAHYLEKIVYLPSENYRYQLDRSFAYGTFTQFSSPPYPFYDGWKNIFSGIDSREHIFTLWFNKTYFQQNDFQMFFEPRNPHRYMLKPTRQAVLYWETIWDNYSMSVNNTQPWRTRTTNKGTAGDFGRGYGISYAYLRDGVPIPPGQIRGMLYLKSENDLRTANLITENADTVVWKYSWNKDIYDMDPNFIIYRAAGIHLLLAEVYVYWAFNRGGNIMPFTSNAVNLLNDGANYSAAGNRQQLGVRGRVGFGGSVDGARVGNINYLHDPFNNEVIGYIDVTGNFPALQELLEEKIVDEKARELAFEGERFYDLMRVAKRRNDPSFLAERVSAKYPSGQREQIYNLLLDENNWYINYFEE